MNIVPIEALKARVCFDSRGQETVQVDVFVKDGFGKATAPSGASVGKFEVISFPEGGAKAAVRRFKEFSSRFIGLDASDPQIITERLKEIDGTSNYSRIGGATAFAISVAAVDAASKALQIPMYRLLSPDRSYEMPYPIGNVLGGGKHAGEGTPDIQEFLVCAVGAENIMDAISANVKVHKIVRKQIEKRDSRFTGGKGDEGAWAPRVRDDEAFEIVYAAIEDVVRDVGFEIKLGVDFAASSMWNKEKRQYLYGRSGIVRDSGQQIEYVREVAREYRLIYVEDPLDEEDFQGFAELTSSLSDLYIVGDDLFVTNSDRLVMGAEIGAGNAAILKVNQAGSLGDALSFAETASKKKYAIIASHRSGDTPESHLAHIALAASSRMIKCGVVGGERVSKLNELLRIDEEAVEEGQRMEMAQLRF